MLSIHPSIHPSIISLAQGCCLLPILPTRPIAFLPPSQARAAPAANPAQRTIEPPQKNALVSYKFRAPPQHDYLPAYGSQRVPPYPPGTRADAWATVVPSGGGPAWTFCAK
jgi:hypothetical protein